MQKFWLVIGILLALLSIAAGFAKVSQMPQEAVFFEQLGLDVSVMIIFGILQIAGGVSAMVPRFRSAGLDLIALMFALSALQIMLTGNLIFGGVAMIPAILAFTARRKL